ncbi:MAG: hypothetical protein CL840_21725 [Crocinitomicaceae bacterium]|nr:hypothetical protein [Crocinitomicaceae bacterium]|tara:strand:- start:95 stop:925 length:831 start_codon:yes stop_codon:yes gene_type:complete
MKRIISYRNIGICTFFLAAAISGVSQVIDQDHSGTSEKFSIIDDHPAGQSFIPFTEGRLFSVALDISAKECYFDTTLDKMLLEIGIREGKGLAGKLLSRDSVEISLPFSRKFLEVPIESKPKLRRNKTYTITVTNVIIKYCEPISKVPNYLNWYHSDTNSYSKGEGFYFTSAGHSDFYFKTYLLPETTSIFDSKESIGSVNGLVYPNPSAGVFQLTLDKNLVSRLTLFNMYGREVLTEQVFYSNSEQLNLEGYPNGIYFLTIESNGESRTIKLLKE